MRLLEKKLLQLEQATSVEFVRKLTDAAFTVALAKCTQYQSDRSAGVAQESDAGTKAVVAFQDLLQQAGAAVKEFTDLAQKPRQTALCIVQLHIDR